MVTITYNNTQNIFHFHNNWVEHLSIYFLLMGTWWVEQINYVVFIFGETWHGEYWYDITYIATFYIVKMWQGQPLITFWVNLGITSQFTLNVSENTVSCSEPPVAPIFFFVLLLVQTLIKPTIITLKRYVEIFCSLEFQRGNQGEKSGLMAKTDMVHSSFCLCCVTRLSRCSGLILKAQFVCLFFYSSWHYPPQHVN